MCINACFDQNLTLIDEVCFNLKESGKSINDPVKETALDGKNLLHICCQHQDPGLKVIRYVVEDKKADVKKKDKLGNTPVLIACKTGNLEAVKYLEALGCDLEDINML